jgi:hypothetical protein
MMNPELPDAAEEAAGRIGVALRMLASTKDSTTDARTDGWDLAVIEEVLQDIAEGLRAAVKRANEAR